MFITSHNNTDFISNITDAELFELLTTTDATTVEWLKSSARQTAIAQHGAIIKSRGLIEITNYCKQNCYYCGIRAENSSVTRYRLTKQQILDCCEIGDRLGYKTFVLQGGEDIKHSTEWIEDLVTSIREIYPNRAITLSIGERSKEDYMRWFNAGADRYLLRHETADCEHYQKLHPKSMNHSKRISSILTLKEIGYETGVGMMVGSPFQTIEHLIKDIRFIAEVEPEMVGIGPFVSHHETPFANYASGSVELTLRLIAITRLLLPNANIPATTSLGTMAKDGREQGVLCGANVVMPNLSPLDVRKLYDLYDNKIFTDLEAAEGRWLLEDRFKQIGYRLD